NEQLHRLGLLLREIPVSSAPKNHSKFPPEILRMGADRIDRMGDHTFHFPGFLPGATSIDTGPPFSETGALKKSARRYANRRKGSH
ncbi:hypothetical protein, partial [Leptospira interrogans]|uniref:hypothetical protein n=1 Tax=Leptospira interrogans TaxID=173 RepID=UPI001C67C7B2